MVDEGIAAVPTGMALARLWSEAPALMPHGAGCSCVGHVALHLDPAAVEADVLDHLAERYAAQGLHALVDVLSHRRASRGVTFASWLMEIDTAPLETAVRMRLLADLGATLASLARPRG